MVMMFQRRLTWALGLALGLCSACSASPSGPKATVSSAASFAQSSRAVPSTSDSPRVTKPSSAAPTSPATGLATGQSQPLRGKVVVIDPWHQLGNQYFPQQINALVRAGAGQVKACNTTGTATAAGVAEATINFRVAQQLATMLRARGARVMLTRAANSVRAWGPCIDTRGKWGNVLARGDSADLKISLHADGSLRSGARGFHVITPAPNTDASRQRAARSHKLAALVKAQLLAQDWQPSNYIGDEDGIVQRNDLGTLNLSAMPAVMIEMGNLKNVQDARRLISPAGTRSMAHAITLACIEFVS
jgi:N-acetylmuramoyl-L-alanine amidase